MNTTRRRTEYLMVMSAERFAAGVIGALASYPASADTLMSDTYLQLLILAHKEPARGHKTVDRHWGNRSWGGGRAPADNVRGVLSQPLCERDLSAFSSDVLRLEMNKT
ncbi:hypothetical protein EVAR_20154_1 [Eumeta japonica]|uniref:Uncharacterized protein n=1 Tax=Eumeta variegata TaxID=151549 RepID=A0A4C1V2E0_EUMVA|nr:hypothetical protein EVAR_20154_1 [Eumeta japonica]